MSIFGDFEGEVLLHPGPLESNPKQSNSEQSDKLLCKLLFALYSNFYYYLCIWLVLL